MKNNRMILMSDKSGAKNRILSLVIFIAFHVVCFSQERLYLSGKGSDDAVLWTGLPIKIFLKEKLYSWEWVHCHYRKWCINGVWKTCWIVLLDKHKSSFDLESSYAPAIRGGKQIGVNK